MKREVEIIKTNIKDILFELVNLEEEVEVWVTRENFGIKILMWGVPYDNVLRKEKLIERSIDELLENYTYYKERLEL